MFSGQINGNRPPNNSLLYFHISNCSVIGKRTDCDFEQLTLVKKRLGLSSPTLLSYFLFNGIEDNKEQKGSAIFFTKITL
jgi:hypothetical protein